MSKKKKKNNKKRRKLRLGRIFLFLILLFIIFYLIKMFCKFPIKNIFIEGNTYISDQEIIDIAKIENYPSIFKYRNSEIEKRLEKNEYIKKATVRKRKLKEIYIKIEENTVLFYNSKTKNTILLDGREINKELDGPILINYVPNKVYEKLVNQMKLIDSNIVKRISEIKYDPSNVDEERFLLSMNDGNYVYVTLEKLEDINNYVKINLEIINKFGNKKGILNLDAGEYFEIFKD